MSTNNHIYQHQVIIIGGGPAGLTAAIYAARANLSPLVVAGEMEDSLIPGGQLMLTTEVENYPGFPEGIDGSTLIERMQEQAKRFGSTITERWATGFELPSGGPFAVEIGRQWHKTRSVIFANGAAARWLNLPNEEKLRNRGISACATCDGPLKRYRNKHLYVVGGGDSAIEEATFLTRFASHVTIIHRRDALRASKIMQKKAVDNPNIDFLFNTQIIGYEGENSLEGLITKDTTNGQESRLATDGLFMAIGHDPLTKHIRHSGIHLDEKGYIRVRNHVETNIEGVFAAGDVHDVHFRQAITACGFGCMAAIASERWIEEQLHPTENTH